MSYGNKKRLCIIGCTGSVGSSVLSICRHFPDKFEVRSLAARSNTAKISSLIREFQPSQVALTDSEASARLKSEFSDHGIRIIGGDRSIVELVSDPEVDHIVIASSGTSSIPALVKALTNNKEISLANKESLVVAGQWLNDPKNPLCNRVRPLDSEHNAIWQSLINEERERIRMIYLTASGGPFRNLPLEQFHAITPEIALKHPTWQMGAKISIDSATLMNKGIEILEAIYLFNVPCNMVSAVIHPDSFIHGMVQFNDGTLKMIGGFPDMRIPASICLSYPERLDLKRLNLPMGSFAFNQLSFEEPDNRRFPCLGLALEVAREQGPFPPILIGADEVAVHAFLSGHISFIDIPRKIEQVLHSYNGPNPKGIEDACEIVEWAGKKCSELCGF